MVIIDKKEHALLNRIVDYTLNIGQTRYQAKLSITHIDLRELFPFLWEASQVEIFDFQVFYKRTRNI